MRHCSPIMPTRSRFGAVARVPSIKDSTNDRCEIAPGWREIVELLLEQQICNTAGLSC
jgi:hypothetical protein